MDQAIAGGVLDAAHQQLGGPIILIWDNLNGHISAVMRRAIAARSWLRVYRLPGYAPELNAAEGVWSHLKTQPGQPRRGQHRRHGPAGQNPA